MQSEEEKIQNLLNTGTDENIELAFVLMRGTGLRAKLPTQKDVYDWLVYSTSADGDDKKMLKMLVNNEPLSLAQAKSFIKIMKDKQHFTLHFKRKNEDVPTILRWLKWVNNLTIMADTKYLLRLPDWLPFSELEYLELRDSLIIDNETNLNVLKSAQNVNLGLSKSENMQVTFPPQNTVWEHVERLVLENYMVDIDLDLLPNINTLELSYLEGPQFSIRATRPLLLLAEVSITNCDIKNYAADIWSQMPNLTNLYITSQEFDKLPWDFSYCTKLEYLSLEGNQLKELPDYICNFSELTFLDISDNKLKKLPEHFGNLSKLEELIAIGGKLKALPDSIGNLKKLHSLDLGHNALQTLPDTIVEMTSLKELSINSNPIKSLPKKLGEMPNLTQLILSTESAKVPAVAEILKGLPKHISVSQVNY